MSSWGSDLWDRGEVGCSFVSRWSSRWWSQSDLWNRGRSVALLLLNGLKHGDSQLCDKANFQVVITRTLAEAEELGTALPRWFYFSYFNRYDWDVWKSYWLNDWRSCLIILYRYLKDRGEVEREYAKALRKLVAKYQVIDHACTIHLYLSPSPRW